MKVLVLTSLLISLNLACLTAQTNSNQHSESSSPTPVVEQSPTPTSTSSLSPESQKGLANRTISKLEFSQMKKILLNQQSLNIIKTFFIYDNGEEQMNRKRLAEYAGKKELYVLDRDLNNDGIAERFVFDYAIEPPVGQSTGSIIFIFKLENKAWKILTVINGDIAADETMIAKLPITVEFLSSGKKSDFDILKVTETLWNEMKSETYKRVDYFMLEKDGGLHKDTLIPKLKEIYSKDSYKQLY